MSTISSSVSLSTNATLLKTFLQRIKSQGSFNDLPKDCSMTILQFVGFPNEIEELAKFFFREMTLKDLNKCVMGLKIKCNWLGRAKIGNLLSKYANQIEYLNIRYAIEENDFKLMELMPPKFNSLKRLIWRLDDHTTSLSSERFPNLQALKLIDLTNLEDLKGNFGKLKTLKLVDSKIEELNGNQFPNLKKLISYSTSLTRMNNSFPQLKELDCIFSPISVFDGKNFPELEKLNKSFCLFEPPIFKGVFKQLRVLSNLNDDVSSLKYSLRKTQAMNQTFPNLQEVLSNHILLDYKLEPF
jgi:hypothetical protein